MLCEATAVVMLEKGREPLAVGRRKRRATKAQRRALLRRDGGCARPGCPETRIERLHAHHMRHWLFGGRTDLTNLVLLCDTDHGLVHDHDLVLSRQNGRLIVLTPDGRHIWGTADAAFSTGLPGAASTDRPTSPMARPVHRRPPHRHRRRPTPHRAPPPEPGRATSIRRPVRALRRRPQPHRVAPDAPTTGQTASRRSRRTRRSGRTPGQPALRPPRRPRGSLAGRTGPRARPPQPRPLPGRRTARSPTRCRSATTAWICASPSACSWATATSPDASPPRQACPRAADRRFRGKRRGPRQPAGGRRADHRLAVSRPRAA